MFHPFSLTQIILRRILPGARLAWQAGRTSRYKKTDTLVSVFLWVSNRHRPCIHGRSTLSLVPVGDPLCGKRRRTLSRTLSRILSRARAT